MKYREKWKTHIFYPKNPKLLSFFAWKWAFTVSWNSKFSIVQTYTRKRRNEDENEQRSVEIDLINEPGSMREVWDFALVSLFECGGMFWAKQKNGVRPSRSMKNPHSRESERKVEFCSEKAQYFWNY